MPAQSNNAPPEESTIKRWLHTYVPSNYGNIWKLTKNLVTSGKREAWLAMIYAFLGIVVTPLDWFLQIFEKRRYRSAPPSQLPQIFVCGPPRSGTTLVAQVLMKHLPVYYFNNLTSIFPRSPVTALNLFRFFVRNDNDKIQFRSFYGRTSRPSSPNDALYLWDRWVGKDRRKIPSRIEEDNSDDMVMFFNAVEAYAKKPLVNKNNSLSTYASLVAPILKNAFFICLDRDPLFLAQSHLIARRFINANEKVSYGVDLDTTQKTADNYLESLCQDIMTHKNLIQEQQKSIGSDRFIVVPYEDFCANPAKIVSDIARQCLNITIDVQELSEVLKPFRAANRVKLSESEFLELKKAFQNIKLAV